MDRFRRVSAAVVTAVAVLAGAGGAAASSGVPAPPVRPSVAKPAALPALSARTTVRTVAAWQEFRVHGPARHLPAGTKVTLQQKQGKRWVSLPASMKTNRNHSYNLRVLLGLRGKNTLRIVGGGAVSPVMRVTVR
ncbi:hypothetical protein [Streptomyces fulvorobeus]|uniref:Uncharacterized protein n=1 Tax=Streptomyces fulvorobeus TaxID=284028 RepID=A0A7J0BYW8_9ACTN|nr:hypothetical protein [Streptomyces fulvorobeus]NYE39233.1 hypothetical protein [Streptomyces fulvorobeus]GFM95439.1 hypothetical protein Sfulv_02500 [Streptomyces fulvorobeus]